MAHLTRNILLTTCLTLLSTNPTLIVAEAISEEDKPPLRAEERSAMEAFILHRDKKRDEYAQARAITTPNGIDVIESTEINGLKQWVKIRGNNKDNPVLLYLHGGPGSASMPFSYSMSSDWEKDFTIVHWDQRGTGKTRCSNPEYDPKTATFHDFYADTVAVINFLKDRLNKEKIIVLGHSWGTLLGTHLAKKNPELIHAYVGTGQMTNTIESETRGYEFALEQAQKHNDTEAVEKLKSIAPYPPNEKVATAELQRKVSTQRKYLQKYGGAVQGSYMEKIYEAFFKSPDYSICDWMGFIDTQLGGTPYPHRDLTGMFLQKEAGLANFDQDLGFDFSVPIFFFLGALDYQTSTTVATQYFDKITAPHKELVIFEKSGHAPPSTEEKKFVDNLVNLVRPYATKK